MTIRNNTWKSIASKHQEEVISFQLKKIANLCSDNIKHVYDLGLYTGLSGMILYLSYYSRHYKSTTYEDSIDEAFNKTIGLLNSSEQIPSFCSGVAGVGWMMMHLKGKGLVNFETNDFFEDIDYYLYSALKNDLKNDNYDFLHGYLGILYYFLERLEFNLSLKVENLILDAIQNVFTKIKTKAIGCEEGIKWKSKVSRSSDVFGYNLGLAHGIPSIINLSSG